MILTFLAIIINTYDFFVAININMSINYRNVCSDNKFPTAA